MKIVDPVPILRNPLNRVNHNITFKFGGGREHPYQWNNKEDG
jgi:hypothetical protein